MQRRLHPVLSRLYNRDNPVCVVPIYVAPHRPLRHFVRLIVMPQKLHTNVTTRILIPFPTVNAAANIINTLATQLSSEANNVDEAISKRVSVRTRFIIQSRLFDYPSRDVQQQVAIGSN